MCEKPPSKSAYLQEQMLPEKQEKTATELIGRVKARLAEIRLIEAQAVAVSEAEETKGMG